MKLKTIKINKDGQVETMFLLSPEQYHALVNHAINDLLMKGICKSIDLSPEEEETLKKEALSEAQISFLETVDRADLPNA